MFTLPLIYIFLLFLRTGDEVPESYNGCRNMTFHVAGSQSERPLWQPMKWLYFCPKASQMALVFEFWFERLLRTQPSRYLYIFEH